MIEEPQQITLRWVKDENIKIEGTISQKDNEMGLNLNVSEIMPYIMSNAEFFLTVEGQREHMKKVTIKGLVTSRGKASYFKYNT